jgi:replicative DNA helicase
MLEIPKQDLNAEAGVLSCIMLDPGLLRIHRENLSDEYFYSTAHKNIFHAISEILEDDRTIDLIKLASVMTKNETLENTGGASYLNTVSDFVVSPDHFLDYLQIIINLTVERKASLLGASIQSGIASGTASMQDIITNTELELKEYRDILQRLTSGTDTIKDRLAKMIGEANKNGGSLPIKTIKCGIKKLDDKGFLTRNKMTIMGGRPAHGKSSVAYSIINNLINSGQRVICISSEWTKEDFIVNMIRQQHNVNDYDACSRFEDYSGKILNSQYVALDNLVVEDLTYTKSDLFTKFYKNHNKQRCDVLIIDQMTNITDDKAKKNSLRTYEIEAILNQLEKTTEEEKIATLILSQMNRQCEAKDFPLPSGEDFRDSGAFEQKAFNLCTIMRPEKYYYERKDKKAYIKKMEELALKYGCDVECKGLLLFNFCKARKGETGVVEALFQTPGTRVSDWEDDRVKEWNSDGII